MSVNISKEFYNDVKPKNRRENKQKKHLFLVECLQKSREAEGVS